MKLLKSLIPTAVVAIAISACGGGPDLDKVKEDFNSPSGSGNDKNGVIAASGKQEASTSNSALASVGGGVPGVGLTSTNQRGFSKIAPARIFGSRINNIAAVGTNRSNLRVAQDEMSCFDSSELTEASAELETKIMAGEEAEVSVDFSVNMEDCGAGMTGTLDLSMTMKVTQTSISYEVEYQFGKVCETESGDCLDGAMAQEGAVELGGTLGIGSLKLVTAWDLTADYTDEDGKKQAVKTKGGIRIGYSSTGAGETAEVEMLVYVVSNGEEYSYVLVIKASTVTGEVTLEIRCTDGELSCSFNESTGAGMCTGDFQLEWDEGEYDTVTESDEFFEG